MEKRNLWKREEYIVVLNLYYKLPFGKLHQNTKEVKELAALIGRTKGSVAMRLTNFAACNPYILSTGRHGLEAGKNSVSLIGMNLIMIGNLYFLKVRKFLQS